MRDKIKFEKLEEISMKEIQGGDNGELNKVKCVLLMVIFEPDFPRMDTETPSDYEKGLNYGP